MNDDHETSEPDESNGPDREPTGRPPEVDELEDRLRDVDAAMELLQAGDLDAAEAAIEALENRTNSDR